MAGTVNQMTEGKPFSTIFFFALPMLIGNVFQQLYNTVDSVIVGRFVGQEALAAVTSAFPVVFLIISVALGITMGCATVISQLYGAQRIDEMKKALSTALIALNVVGIVLSILGIFFAGDILRSMNTRADILEEATWYLIIMFAGMPGVFLYNGLSAAFRAIGDSKTPLIFLIIASVLNIGLDLLFVLIFQMGVPGVAIATVIAQFVSAFLCILYIIRYVPLLHFTKKELVFEKSMFATMLRMAVPSTAQQLIVSFGIIAMQSLINTFSVAFIAGFGAATKIETFVIMPILNISMAFSTFVAQNIGAQKIERIKEGYKACMIMAVGFGIVMTGMAFLFGEQMMGLFLDVNKSQEAVSVGISYIAVVSMFYFLFGAMLTANGVLRGAGDMSVFMLGTILNLVTRVGAAYMLAGQIGQDAIWWSVPIGWAMSAFVANARYFTGGWKNKQVIQAVME